MGAGGKRAAAAVGRRLRRVAAERKLSELVNRRLGAGGLGHRAPPMARSAEKQKRRLREDTARRYREHLETKRSIET